MIGKHQFSGTGVALVTPFAANGSIDFDALARLVERVIEGGVDYILALGTTSENPTLSADERRAVAIFIRERVAGRVPIMVGVGGNCTRNVVEVLRSGITDGYDAVLSVCPYYNKPNQEGLYRHFKAVSEASSLPVVLYNIPGRSGVNMTPETMLRIVEDCPNVAGVKEASGNLEQMERIASIMPEHFALISGDDGLTVDVMRMGGVGVISVLANLYPSAVSAVVALATERSFDEADKVASSLSELTSLLFAEGNPTGVKCALSIAGVCGDTVRLPLAEGSAVLVEKLQKAIREYEKR